MEFGVLGPLLLRAGSRELTLPGAKERALLAYLLLHANEPVSFERLIDALWPDDPPATARNALQVRVSNLRKLLGVERIETKANGYVAVVDRNELDLLRFRVLVAGARETEGPDAAVELLIAALALWRGNPLPEFTESLAFGVEIARLEEERLSAFEERMGFELDVGRAAELVPELQAAVGTNPLRERLMGQLMVALYRAGRQTQALEVYGDARRRLVDELGIEPGPLLSDLHQRILGQDPLLLPPTPRRSPVADPSRRQLTVVLAALPVQVDADPEVGERALERPRATARAILEDYGAIVSDRPGEVVAGAFGLPVLREDDALRALQAASDLSRDLGLPVAVDTRVALVSGETLADEWIVSRLLRLVDAASGGEVVVGEGTRKLAIEAAQFAESAGGGSWRLTALDTTAEPIARHFDTPLVGREHELERLRAAYEWSVSNRRSHLVTLVGPAGIGKSRLARELAASVAGQATVLSGRCLAYGSGAFWPLAEMVRQVAGDTTPAALDALLEELEDRRLVVDQLAAALGTGSGMRAEDAFWAFRRLFMAVSDRRPLVLVFEDLHWGEERLLEFIEELVERAETAPILVLCLSRPDLVEERESWGGGRLDSESMQLAPLSPESSRELIHILGRSVPEKTRGRIATRAEGNPLFIEQLVALAAEDPASSDEAIPLSLQAVLAARVDRLEADERALLERASIIGLEFSLAGVAALSTRLESVNELTQVARRLVRKDLLRPVGPEIRGADGYRFLHLLIRDVVYGSVLKATRAELHERFARWLEQDLQERAGDVEEIIGYHLARSYELRKELEPDAEGLDELANEAGEHLARAGRQHLDRSDTPAALDLLERSRNLLGSGSSTRGDLYAALGYVFRLLGRWDEARVCLKEGLSLAEASEDGPLLAYLRVSDLQLRLHADETFSTDEFIRLASECLIDADRAGPRYYSWRIRGVLAWAYALSGQCRTAEKLVVDATSSHQAAADAAKLLPSLWLGGPLTVAEAVAKCEDLLMDPPSPRTAASAYRSLAVLRAMRGEFPEARALLERDSEILDELGVAVVRAASASNRATVELLAEKPAQAERVLRAAIAQLEALGAAMYVTGLGASLSRALLEQGREEEAWSALRAADETFARDVSYRVEHQSIRARLLLGGGSLGEAERVALAAVALADTTDSPDLQADARIDLAHILRESGRASEGNAVLERAVALYDQKGNQVEAGRARGLLGG